MKKIKLKLDELKSPQVLTAKQLKSIMGAASLCNNGIGCGPQLSRGVCGTFSNEGSDEVCKCHVDNGYDPSYNYQCFN